MWCCIASLLESDLELHNLTIKMKNMKNIGISLLLMIITLGASAQGAWPKKQNEGFFKLSQSVIVSDAFYSPEGTIQDIKTAGVHISSIYAEYGLTDKLTAVAFVPFLFRNTINRQEFLVSTNEEEGDESNSFGDFNIGLQYSLLQKGPFVLSTSLLLGVPSGETAGGESMILQSGDGEFNQLLRVHAGYSFYPKPFYAAAYAGVNNRTKDFSDEFHFGLEAGAAFQSGFFVALKLAVVESFMNGDASASQTGIFSNNTEFISFGPELAYSFGNNWSVAGSALGAFSGRNILASPMYSLGIVFELK